MSYNTRRSMAPPLGAGRLRESQSQPRESREPQLRESRDFRESRQSRQSIAPGRGLSDIFETRIPNTASQPRNSMAHTIGNSGGIRKSMVPRSSRMSMISGRSPRASFGVSSAFQNLSSSSNRGMVGRDPRPVKDKNYQITICSAIEEYLLSHNYELETRRAISIKILKSPSQRDFETLFKWLYNRLDPGYIFTKSIEQEVYFVLRALRYPYMESINKSQLAAVGGQGWPYFLAMLYWLLELAKMLECYDENFETSEKTDEQQISLMLNKYTSQAYKAYIAGEGDFSEYRQVFELQLSKFFDNVNVDIEATKQEINELNDILEARERDIEAFDALQEKSTVLESDLQKFKEYIANVESRKTKWSKTLQDLSNETTRLDNEIEHYKNGADEFLLKLQEYGLTPGDVNKFIHDRETLNTALSTCNTRREQLTEALRASESRLNEVWQSLEAILNDYHAKLPHIRAPSQFVLSLNSPLSISKDGGVEPRDILGSHDLTDNLKPMLIHNREEIWKRANSLEDDVFVIKDEFDQMADVVKSKQATLQEVQIELTKSNASFSEYDANTQAELGKLRIEAESLENKANVERNSIGEQSVQLEQEVERKRAKVTEVEIEARRILTVMTDNVTDMLQDIVEFKLRIESNLASYERSLNEIVQANDT